jgi:hypothetical protein
MNMAIKLLFVALAFSISLIGINGQAAAEDALPEGLVIQAIRANAEQVKFSNRYAYHQLLVTGVLPDGETADLTRLVKLTTPAKFVTIDKMGLIRPIADGSETLALQYGQHHISLQVTVENYQQPYQPSFIRDIQPVFSRVGCNSGTCHGSKDGKNGFKLSLRGYDPLFDFLSFTDDIGGRRFNRVAPDQFRMSAVN